MIWCLIILLISLWALKIEVPRLRQKQGHKELWIFLASISTSALFSMAVSLHLRILNPLDVITYLFKPMGKMITTLLT
ncbi:hypothetical protein [Paenibacillus qinlingensis]|uniref:Uncharacterized protein n=1 Tax=Paenibacillus qinlingensis TaxID=1837343 RepID=A0ABU1P167_9BACL|nr:hypothetical protein [Paenibacillus qinlingensis]MDR6553481.1 hypothetical protein [Paenibacillus qinlingensis]